CHIGTNAAAQALPDCHGGFCSARTWRIGAAKAKLIHWHRLCDGTFCAGETSQGFQRHRAAYTRTLSLIEFRASQTDSEEQEDVILRQRWVASEINLQIIRISVGVERNAPVSGYWSAARGRCGGERPLAAFGCSAIFIAPKFCDGGEIDLWVEASWIIESNKAPLYLELVLAERNLPTLFDFYCTHGAKSLV